MAHVGTRPAPPAEAADYGGTPPTPPAQPADPDGPPPRPKRRRIAAWIVALLVLAALGAAGWYIGHSAPAAAAVGDCVQQTGADSLTIVGCDNPAAQFKVAGRLENRTMVDAGLFACSAFPTATSSYWEGKQGETGIVLCLEPVKR